MPTLWFAASCSLLADLEDENLLPPIQGSDCEHDEDQNSDGDLLPIKAPTDLSRGAGSHLSGMVASH